MCKPTKLENPQEALEISIQATSKALKPTHSQERDTKYDILWFLGPSLFFWLTPVVPLYITAFARIFAIHLVLALHYIFVDKDNYYHKLSQKQLEREREHYLVATVLHMWVQIPLQVILPSMFFADASTIGSCAILTLASHIFLVEPLYYAAHRWLHIPENMKKMHGFHHLSIKTTPSTSLVQNFEEHFVYVATFGPAFFVPFFVSGHQHWAVIAAYLVIFDVVNAYGHTHIRIRSKIATHPYSPVRYLLYTPEFHLGHHAYFNANYGLFSPFLDMVFGTYREYKLPEVEMKPALQQDVVFIGHNAGLGHLLTCPELSIYNSYGDFGFYLPLMVDFLLMRFIGSFARLFMKNYSVSRYLVDNKYIGRVITLVRTPWDFMTPARYPTVNKEIVELIKDQYIKCGTRYFGLGNLTKMKQLNDGGRVISELVKKDAFLKDKNIRVWTGDTLTSASVFNQIMDIPNLKRLFFIGGNGKIGTAVCHKLLERRPNVKICILSRYEGIKLPNVTYTENMSDMADYEVVLVGKYLMPKEYTRAFAVAQGKIRTRYILDYTVPFMKMNLKVAPEVKHIAIGVLQASTTKKFLQGSFDVCMSHDENHIYPCHTGCIINMVYKRETDEIGDVDPVEMDIMWARAQKHGFQNKVIDY